MYVSKYVRAMNVHVFFQIHVESESPPNDIKRCGLSVGDAPPPFYNTRALHYRKHCLAIPSLPSCEDTASLSSGGCRR